MYTVDDLFRAYLLGVATTTVGNLCVFIILACRRKPRA